MVPGGAKSLLGLDRLSLFAAPSATEQILSYGIPTLAKADST